MSTSISDTYILKIKQTVLRYLQDEPVSIVVFGSRARGDERSGSDLDIGLIPKGEYDRKRLILLREELDEINVPYIIDLVDLSQTSEEFREIAMRDIIVWKK